jgi:hypothetical protein
MSGITVMDAQGNVHDPDKPIEVVEDRELAKRAADKQNRSGLEWWEWIFALYVSFATIVGTMDVFVRFLFHIV